ncbi:hypothetical protein [Corynebacterium sp.]|uniref:hypothetical protein n=1 Tax=Corynebacterium sp. TaxID=1720 RepID=UPI00198EBBA4|nr:hypothetical protein [Corynebacterium sp.]HHU68412.1 hypothetical protein [Corynebacterium sp.]
MLSWLLLIVLSAAFVVLGVWFWGSVFGRGELLEPLDPQETLEANRHAVGSGRIDDVQFELVPRGYRPEQVDDVISHLTWRLREAEDTLSRLSSEKID